MMEKTLCPICQNEQKIINNLESGKEVICDKCGSIFRLVTTIKYETYKIYACDKCSKKAYCSDCPHRGKIYHVGF